MKNAEVAKLLYQMSILLDMEDVQFKPRAYEKAAEAIEALGEDIEEIYKKGGLDAIMEIPGIGFGIAKKIEEYLRTGHVTEHERLKKKIPVDIDRLSAIEGLGPKRIKILYKKLKVKNVNDLEKIAKKGKIRELEGFGEKSERNILKGIEFLKRSSGRFILGYVLPQVREIENRLKKLKEVKKVTIGGSVRRRKETIGDADILVVSDKPASVMKFFTSMPEVINVFGKGETKSSIKLKNGLNVDMRVVPEKSYGAAMQYFTGNVEHNVALRRIAIQKGMKLSEYGVFKGNKQIAGKTEEEVYKILGLRYIEPEMRENMGEIEAARKNILPTLIDYNDLKGDLQTQTNWTDGQNSIKEMAEAARSVGLEYIAITDHTKSLAMTGGLDEKKLEKQMKEIDELNKKLRGITILKGAEVNIMKDGSLDIKDETLKKLDIVGAAIHINFNMPMDQMTKRIVKAMENPNVDILYHPTGRVIQQREPYAIDIDAVIDAAKETGTVLEIDSFPTRLDLKDEHIRKVVKCGARLVIDSDAHSISHFKFLEFGIAQARRGWAEATDVINTRKLDRMLRLLK